MIAAVVRICSANFEWSLLILLLPRNRNSQTTKFWSFIGKFSRLRVFLKITSS